MVPSFVILKGADGKPAKGVFLAAQDNEIIVCDPEQFRDVRTGVKSVTRFSRSAVFHFEENAFRQLMAQWEASKTTATELWARLGHVRCGISLQATREAA